MANRIKMISSVCLFVMGSTITNTLSEEELKQQSKSDFSWGFEPEKLTLTKGVPVSMEAKILVKYNTDTVWYPDLIVEMKNQTLISAVSGVAEPYNRAENGYFSYNFIFDIKEFMKLNVEGALHYQWSFLGLGGIKTQVKTKQILEAKSLDGKEVIKFFIKWRKIEGSSISRFLKANPQNSQNSGTNN